MTKILIRSGIAPFESPTYEQIITTSLLGGNLGNLLYAASIFKTLYVNKNTSFETIYQPYNISKKEIDRINNTCEYFVLPLADAIRKDFIQSIEWYTDIIKSLKIPCYIVGMGVRAPYEPEIDFRFSFDGAIKEFVSAVLDKSATVGVRGQITADYLSRLGFKDDKITPIGCPSMYLYGDNLHIKRKKVDKNSKITYNTHIFKYPTEALYLYRQAQYFLRHYLIPQEKKELLYLYIGKKLNVNKLSDRVVQDMYLNNKCLFFNNVKRWLNFLEDVDFTFGTRLHGCIASLIKSNPILFFPHDARQRELASFHNLPQIPLHKIDENQSIIDLLDRISLYSPEKVHRQNFENYVNFLNQNEIQNIWSNREKPIKSLYDKKIKNIKQIEIIKPYNIISLNEFKIRNKIYRRKKISTKLSVELYISRLINTKYGAQANNLLSPPDRFQKVKRSKKKTCIFIRCTMAVS